VHDDRLGRDIALKILPASLTADAEARARLTREARTAATLSHPHVCTVFEVGEAEGHVYLTMELVEGESLSQRIKGGALPIEQVLDYGAQIAAALAHAHDRRVIHRDLKGSNVVITSEGHVKVLDFGLAKRVEEPEDLTRQSTMTMNGMIVGTPHYL